jgi:hypothetical protein
MYLVRGADGAIRTIMAPSMIAATKKYIREYPVESGDTIWVKERGAGDWTDYDIK